MTKWTVLVGALVMAVGCTKPNPALSCEDGLCSDPTVPYCDVTGSISGEPNTCIHVSCMANEFVECRGDKALTCNATGDNYDLLSCAYGCDDNGCKPPPPCETLECQKHIIPKYVATECDTLATTDLTVSADTTLDTSMDTMCTRIVSQTGAPDLCVVHHATITVERNHLLRVTGSRVLALVADKNVVVDGVLDIGYTAGAGPGGGFLTSGQASGGAGYRTSGGAAGTTVDGGAANGGPATANPKSLATLLGGFRSPLGTNRAAGGATLISCRGKVIVSGLIDANGGGGGGGNTGLGAYKPPAGGSSGGTVVLQGITLEVTGELYANGGGGGGGGPDDFSNQAGGDGLRSLSAAPGGPGSGPALAGTGGVGGATSSPTNGYGQSDGLGGAGGGAAGYILTYTAPGSVPVLTPFAVSPGLEPNEVLPTN